MIKKIIFLMLLFIISPVYAMNPTVEYIDNVYANKIYDGKMYSGQFGFIIDEGKVLYCIEPYKWIGRDYTEEDILFDSMSDDTKNYIKLVANYVSDKVQNKNVEYYMVAQDLIWYKLTKNKSINFTTEKDGRGDEILINSLRTEVDLFAFDFLQKPTFDGEIISGNIHETIQLSDEIDVLKNYDIINETKNEVWVDNNKLYIKILSGEKGKIRFVKKYGEGKPKYYHNPNKQDLADLTGEVIVESEITVSPLEDYYNDYRIEFIDKETNELVESNISFEINDNIYSTTNGIYMDRAHIGKNEVNVKSVPDDYIIPSISYFEIKDGLANNYVHKIYLEKKHEDVLINNEDIKDDELHNSLNEEDIIHDESNNPNIDDEKNYCILTNFKELPNTFNYIKVLKILIIIIIVIEIIRHVKEIFKN